MTSEDVITSEPTLAALIRDFAARWRLPATVRVEGDIEALDDSALILDIRTDRPHEWRAFNHE